MLHANIERALDREDIVIVPIPRKGESPREWKIILTNKAMRGDDALFLVGGKSISWNVSMMI